MDSVQRLAPAISKEIQEWIDEGKTFQEISDILQAGFPSVTRGLSARSLRRFCRTHSIQKRKGAELDSIVSGCINEVGHAYGRKMMKGHLAVRGFRVSEALVDASLKRVCPDGHEARRSNSINRLNPIRYQANYFGHKLHVDQNEKLITYGVTHVVARDGFSGKVVSYLTLPIKNNLAIYDQVYRTAVDRYGLWDQVRIDHGREFYLLIYIQEQLRRNYGARDVLPYVQSRSTENVTVERIWPEVNHRVNYPLKEKVIEMEEQGQINMDDRATKFCVSFVLVNVAGYGLQLFVQAWNSHPISGKGVPNNRERQRYGVTPLAPSVLPSTDSARQMYLDQGGNLTAFSHFGKDPLHNREDLVRRRDGLFQDSNPSYQQIFSNVVNGNGHDLKDAILSFIDITRSLEQLL